MTRYRLDILGISECCWTDAGRQGLNDGSVILYSGHQDCHVQAVAIIVPKNNVKTLALLTHYSKKTVNMNSYTQQPQRSHSIICCWSWENAEVGNDNSNFERAMGKHGCGAMNENGKKFTNFCLDNNCVIGGTLQYFHTKTSTNLPGTHLMVILLTRLTTLQWEADGEDPSKM